MDKRNRLIFISIILLLLASCSNKNAKILNVAEKLVQENADSAICLLHSIDKTSLSEHELAKYSLLYTMSQDKVGMDIDNDSLIRIAYNYYNAHQQDSLYGKCQYYMGTYYAIVDSIKACETCMNKAISASRKTNDSHTLYLALDRLCRVLRDFDTKTSIIKGKEALKVLEESEPDNVVNKAYLMLSMGETYLFAHDKKECYDYFAQALELATSLDDSALVSYVYQDYAAANLEFKDYKEALEHSSASLEYSTSYDESQHMTHAIALLDCGYMSEAEVKFREILHNTHSNEMKSTIYDKLCHIAIDQNDYLQNVASHDSALYYAFQENNHIRSVCYDYYKSSLEQEKSKIQLQSANKMKQRTIVFISIFATVLIGLIFTLYRLHKVKAQRRFELATQEHAYKLKVQEELHRIELENQEKDFQRDMQLKDSQLSMMRQYMLDSMEILKQTKGHASNSKIILTDSDWLKIRNFLEKVDGQFISRLSSQFPDLSEKDIRFCMLIRLGFTTKDLTDVYCVNERSIKQKLLKFKTKVELFDPNISFRQFIQSY